MYLVRENAMEIWDANLLTPWSDSSLVLQTNDLDQARDVIGRLYCPYRFDAQLCSPRQIAAMHCLKGSSIELSEFSYGCDIDIQPEVFADFLLVLTTIRGQADISAGSTSHRGGVGMTVVTSNDKRWRFRYSENNQQYVIRIALSRVAELATSLTGSTKRLAPTFSSLMSDSGMVQRWMHQIGHLQTLLDPCTPTWTRNMLLPRAEELLISSLLLQQSNSTVEAVRSVSTEVTPAALRRAIDYIHEQLDQSLTLEDIAAAARCSVRSLHRIFRTYRDTSVMHYVKHLRLQRVHSELMNPLKSTSITDVALHWGFTQLGQFAADYRALFGEKPSDTLRRR